MNTQIHSAQFGNGPESPMYKHDYIFGNGPSEVDGWSLFNLSFDLQSKTLCLHRGGGERCRVYIYVLRIKMMSFCNVYLKQLE